MGRTCDACEYNRPRICFLLKKKPVITHTHTPGGCDVAAAALTSRRSLSRDRRTFHVFIIIDLRRGTRCGPHDNVGPGARACKREERRDARRERVMPRSRWWIGATPKGWRSTAADALRSSLTPPPLPPCTQRHDQMPTR